jgi:hypothetical protein
MVGLSRKLHQQEALSIPQHTKHVILHPHGEMCRIRYVHTALFTGGRYGDGEMAGETIRHVVHREMVVSR